MKNTLLLLALFASLFYLSACNKEKENKTTIVSKVINVDLDENQSYSYNMPPSGDADDVMIISVQSKHYITSKVTSDNLRNTLFEYTPALNYSGSDEIHITTMEGAHKDANHDHQHGNCSGHH